MPRRPLLETEFRHGASATGDKISRPASIERGRRSPGLLLAPLSGALLALCFLAAWLFVGRALTGRALTAASYVFIASTLSVAAARLVLHRLSTRPWSARFAAALLLLLAGPAALTAFLMAVQTGLRSHAIREVPLSIAILLAGLFGASALYGFLTVAGKLMLPLGLPLAGIIAAAIARRPRPPGDDLLFHRDLNGEPHDPTL